MASEHPSSPPFNIKIIEDDSIHIDAAYFLGIDKGGKVMLTTDPGYSKPKKKKKAKPDPLWDLEPHKVEFQDPKTMVYQELFISGPENIMTFTGSFPHNDMTIFTLPPFNKFKHPEKFIHKCSVCDKIDLDEQNIVCDPCLTNKDNSIVLEGEDLRQHDLILGE